jgi:hypothetical protein
MVQIAQHVIKMKKYIKILIGVLAFCILCNFSIFRAVFNVATSEGYYRYSNYNGSCTSEEPLYKGTGLSRPKAIHQDCLIAYPKQPDTNLYRLFAKNPLAFWRWRSYLFDERYELPYKSWKEIEKIRKEGKDKMQCHTDF